MHPCWQGAIWTTRFPRVQTRSLAAAGAPHDSPRTTWHAYGSLLLVGARKNSPSSHCHHAYFQRRAVLKLWPAQAAACDHETPWHHLELVQGNCPTSEPIRKRSLLQYPEEASDLYEDLKDARRELINTGTSANPSAVGSVIPSPTQQVWRNLHDH